jgi:large subunit ribosomal protein L31
MIEVSHDEPVSAMRIPPLLGSWNLRPGSGGKTTVKPNIHPEYHEVTVHCACGNSWTTRTTAKELHLDICSNCHPFFTGRQKLVDTEGRVDRFQKKFGAQTSEARKTAAKAKKEAVAKKTVAKRKAS